MVNFQWTLKGLDNEDLIIEEQFDDELYAQKYECNSLADICKREDKITEEDPYAIPSYFLSDIQSVTLMHHYVKDHNYMVEDQEVSFGYNESLDFLASAKYLLVKINRIETAVRNDENSELKRNASTVSQFIKKCRETEKNSNNPPPKPEDYFRDWGKKFMEYAQKIVNAINNGKTPYNLYNKLVALLSDDVEDRFNLFMAISPYKRYQPNKQRQLLSCQLAINDNYYLQYLSETRNEIVSKCNFMYSAYTNASSINDASFKNTIRKMIKCIDKFPNENNFKRYKASYNDRDKRPGCFGILETSQKTYISLSGTRDAMEKPITDFLTGESTYPDEKIWNLINSFIKVKFPHSKYSEVCLMTKSYGLFTNKNVFIPCTPPISAKEAIENMNFTNDEFSKLYSCCERKMFAKLTVSCNKPAYLFTKIKACKKCRPAIKDVEQTFLPKIVQYYYKNGSIKRKKR